MNTESFIHKNRKILVFGVILLVLILVLVLIASLANRPVLREGLDDRSSELIYVNDSGKLSDLLFELQYYAVQNAVSDYINVTYKNQVSSSTQAKISGDPIIPKDGVIRFDVDLDNPNKKFTVEVDRSVDFDKIGFSVAGTDYKKTLNVYEADPGAETEE